MPLCRTLIGLVIGCGAVCGVVGQPASEVQRLTEEIFQLDGTAQALKDKRAVHEGDLERQLALGQLPPEQAPMHRAWIEVVFGGSAFAVDYTHGFMEEFDAGHAREVLRWLRSPLVQRLAALGGQSDPADYFEKLNAFLEAEYWNISEARRELLRRDAEQSGCTEFRLDVRSVQQMARMSVLNRFLPPGEQWTPDEMEQRVREMRENLREGVAGGCWIPKLYAYRDISDAELEQYLAFNRTPAGQWLRRAHRNATLQAWLSAGKRLGEQGFTWPEDADWRP